MLAPGQRASLAAEYKETIRTKNNCGLRSQRKSQTVRYKRHKPTAVSRRNKTAYWAWCLHKAPPKVWAGHLSHPSSPSRWPTLPSPHLRNQPILLGSQQGHLLLVFTPLYCSMNRNKALLEILIWPLLSFYWLKSPRTQTDHITMLTPLLPELREGKWEVWTRSNPWIGGLSSSVYLSAFPN